MKFSRNSSLDLAKSNNSAIAEKNRPSARFTVLLIILASVPAILDFALLYKEAFSAPYQDDFGAVLAFATDYQHLPTLSSKAIMIIGQQSNDYKLVFAHFVIATQLEVASHINFSFLVALGNLFLIPTAYILWRTYAAQGFSPVRQLFHFMTISLMFFSLTYWETLDWAMAGLQNLPVIFFSLSSIYLLVPKDEGPLSRGRMCFSCIAAILAALSSANGFLLAPVGLLILIPRRAFAASLAWCLNFLVPIAIYAFQYVPYNNSSHSLHTSSFAEKVALFFAFLGCAIPNGGAAVFLGLVISAVFALAVRARYEKINPVAFFSSIWILGTAILVACMRSGIASRYSVYSILLLIFCYSFLTSYLPGFSSEPQSFLGNPKSLYLAFLLAALGFFVAGDLSAHKHLQKRRLMVLTGIENYAAKPEINSPMIDPLVAREFPEEVARERTILTDAIQAHVYNLPPALLTR